MSMETIGANVVIIFDFKLFWKIVISKGLSEDKLYADTMLWIEFLNIGVRMLYGSSPNNIR